MRQAPDIRAYVEEARAANADATQPVAAQDMDLWARRTLSLEARIDPVRTDAFRLGRKDYSAK